MHAEQVEANFGWRREVYPTHEMEAEPSVAGLVWYPLKSGRPHFADRLYADPHGFKPSASSPFGDRISMVVNQANGKLISAREEGMLALMEMTIAQDNSVTVTVRAEEADERMAPKIPSGIPLSFTFTPRRSPNASNPERSVTVHQTHGIGAIAQDSGLNQWLSRFFKKDVELVLADIERPRFRDERAPDFPDQATIVFFEDSSAFSGLSYETLKILNTELRNRSMAQFQPFAFRMNLLLRGINEHTLIGKYVQIDEALFYVWRPKERCVEPARKPDGAMMGGPRFASDYQTVLRELHDPLGIPHAWRETKRENQGREVTVKKANLGVDMILIRAGNVRAGSPVQIFDTPPV
jgi:uncharacterized protein YcbX